MATCDYCGGHGHTSVRNGDDDVTCEACKGSGEGVTAAAPEPLSAVAQLRIDLDTYEKADIELQDKYHGAQMSYVDSERYVNTRRNLYHGLLPRLHMLFDHIDAQAAEIVRLKVELEAACGIVNAMCGTIVRDVK